MDGFYVAKFKVQKRMKVKKGGGGDNGKGDEDVNMRDDDTEKPAFDDEEDKNYIEGLSPHPCAASVVLRLMKHSRVKAEKHEEERVTSPSEEGSIGRVLSISYYTLCNIGRTCCHTDLILRLGLREPNPRRVLISFTHAPWLKSVGFA